MRPIWKYALLAIVLAVLFKESLASVTVTITPISVHVPVGGQVQFNATVGGTTNSVVIWSLSGTTCSGNQCGHISNTGLYSAPAVAPPSNVITVTAAALADLSVVANSSVILGPTSSVTVSVSPSKVTVLEGQSQRFLASVGGTTLTTVTWSLSGAACNAGACGALTQDGLYTAPSSVPSPALVDVVATSVADPLKSGSAVVTVAAPVGVSISPQSVQINAGLSSQFKATVTGTTNGAIIWSVTGGSGCVGSSCGTVSTSGLYTAPRSVPNPAVVAVTATSVADPSKSASASVTILPAVAVSMSPSVVRVITGEKQQFIAGISNTKNTAVSWTLSGSGCTGAACGTISAGGLYTAPLVVPSPAQVNVTATSVVDPSKSSTAVVTVIPPVSVKILPPAAQVAVGNKQQFKATVTGTTNAAVSWSLSGSGCSSTTCGAVSPTGLYTAPSVVPKPPLVTLTATSAEDPTKSATAQLTITPPVTVSISPVSAQVVVNGQQQFTATVTGSTNALVSWSVAGSGCGGGACGTITSAGLYTAPSAVPNPPQVSVTATSVADPTKSATAGVTVRAPIAVSVTPAVAQVLVGAHQQFTGTVTGTSGTSVSWSVSGAGCSGATCGTVSSGGLYTAPSVTPTPPQVSVTATSVADPSKSGTATVTVSGSVSISISPATAQVIVGSSQQFSASVSGTSNKNVSWSVAGSGCSGTACGTISSTGFYFAPPSVPAPPQVSVTVTSNADPTKSRTATVTILPPIDMTLSPSAATVALDRHQQFDASITGTSNTGVVWSVSGAGCTGTSCGQISSSGLYTAPGSLPTPPQITIKATAGIDSQIYRTATVTLIPVISVSVAPKSADLVVGTHQSFTATVSGTTNKAVTWKVTGTGCNGATCGTITSSGVYTAPSTVPSPDSVTITATSSVDPSKIGDALVTILPPVGVTITPASADVIIGHQRKFTSIVKGSTNTAVSWTVAGNGCTGSACGTIDSTGLYTAPGKIPAVPNVTVKATSVADPSTFGTASVTIIAPVPVSISPSSAVIAVKDQRQFRTTILDGPNATVEWSLSGTGCSGSMCGSINSAGLYTAPAVVPSPATVVITVTSQIDVLQSASAVISIVASNNAKLHGDYAFEFTGFDANGIYQAAGAFVADGNGHITSGVEDINSTSGPLADKTLTGTYQLGSDNRGVLSFITTAGNQTFRFTLNQSSSTGWFIAFDTSGIRGSGSFEQQDSSAFTVSALKGAFVVSLSGKNNNGNRIGALSNLYFDGSGTIVGGSIDVDNAGTILPTYGSITGIYLVDAAGRGELKLSIPGFGGGNVDFSFYVVSSKTVLLVSMDAITSSNLIFGGLGQLQTGAPYLTSSLKGLTVFSLAGENGIPQVLVGTISFDGISQPQALFDQNMGGAVTTGNIWTGAYSVSLNGAGTMDLDDSTGPAMAFKVYVIEPNHAFVMDDSSTAVLMGELKPRTVAPSFTSSAVEGPYSLHSGEPLVSGATLYTGSSEFDGRALVSGTEDTSSSSTTSPGQPLAGKYDIPLSNSGRAVLSLNSPATTSVALWITSYSEAIGVEIDSDNPYPGVLHFDQ